MEHPSFASLPSELSADDRYPLVGGDSEEIDGDQITGRVELIDLIFYETFGKKLQG